MEALSSYTVKKNSYFQSQRVKRRIFKWAIFTLLLGGSFLFLLPFWWMISTSLKTLKEIGQYPPTFIPENFLWQNYVSAWQATDFTRFAINSLLLAVFAVISQVLSNSFIAYGFAKIRFRGKNIMFIILLGTLIIPGFVTLIPQYVMFAKIHWVGTYLPLIVPGFFGSAFAVFMIRQFFFTIPNDLIEAAKIDGASHVYIWWRIMVPLSAPVMITIAILAFNGSWNDFIGPLIYVNKESMYTLQIGLQAFKSSVQTEWHYLMAGSLIVLLPVLVMFFIFQKYFIEGMNISSGTKG